MNHLKLPCAVRDKSFAHGGDERLDVGSFDGTGGKCMGTLVYLCLVLVEEMVA